MTGPIFVPPGILHRILDYGSLLETVYSLHWVSIPPCPSCILGFCNEEIALHVLQRRLWQCHHGVRHVLFLLKFCFQLLVYSDDRCPSKKQSGLSFCVHALQQWPPFRFGLFPVSMLVSYRASSIPDPLQLSHLDFFIAYGIGMNLWTKL